MKTESIQEFQNRRSRLDFEQIIKNEHSLVNEHQLTKKAEKWDRESIVGNIGFDIFSTYYVDGFKIEKKFVIVNNSGPEVDSYNFWSFIWEKCCKVIVRFDGTLKNRNWLNNSQDDAYAVGEFLIRKKTANNSCKYYTQLQITIRNIMERKSRKITHLQFHLHYLDKLPSNGSAQLISFLEMVNKNRGAKSKKSASGPTVIHSVGCFERAVSICVLDICLDQLIETEEVSVIDNVLSVKSQVSFEFFSLEEFKFINKVLLGSLKVLRLKKARSLDGEVEGKAFIDQVRKFSLVFRKMSLSCLNSFVKDIIGCRFNVRVYECYLKTIRMELSRKVCTERKVDS
ncbi:tyrosine-protein phosphatase non-receptor type 9-like [Cotesia glomerata]|uniref:tyrosine-protein phosphatase non-receptor type 9-like n=1 Tax=Cotesia glomerata TaxID=32391 RepID=UPI001D00EC9D|nr:tyrosine-protein phosphatase non-receptor type 9-like [Cotesia glomerata]